MYEAPDRYKRMIAARLPDGESPGYAREHKGDASPLKDVQLIARGQLAPFFALANIVAALLFTAALWGKVDLLWLLGWSAVVAAVNYLRPCAGDRARRWTCVGRAGHSSLCL
jgi:hypothetical protein